MRAAPSALPAALLMRVVLAAALARACACAGVPPAEGMPVEPNARAVKAPHYGDTLFQFFQDSTSAPSPA